MLVCSSFRPSIFALIDSDCVPVTLFEIRELWLASTDPTLPRLCQAKVAKSKLPSPICIIAQTCALCGHGQGYAATWPTIKAVQNRIVLTILQSEQLDPLRAPPLTYGADLADEVDYGGSPDPSPRMSRRASSSSDVSSPAGSTKPAR